MARPVHPAVLLLAESTNNTAAPCATAHDCSPNGDCRSGACACVAAWTGSTCGTLSVLLVDGRLQPGASIYGWSPNVSSWGGDIAEGEDGLFHLFAAQMQEGGLVNWGWASECVHATAKRRGRPFIKQGVAVDNECHGLALVRDPRTSEHLLFHQ
jgi:hypothetical protein